MEEEIQRFNMSCQLTWLNEKKVIWLAEPIILCHHSIKFIGHSSCGRRDTTFLVCHVIWNDYVIKGQITLFVGALHHSHRWVKFDAYRSCEVEINVILTHDSTWPNNRKEISRGKWEPLNLSLHFTKFGTNRSCGSRDMYLFCYVVLRDHMIKRTCDLVSGIPST